MLCLTATKVTAQADWTRCSWSAIFWCTICCCACRIDGVQIPEAVQKGWYMPGIQVLQILAYPLQQRARVFPRLPSHSQVYPGFFDAPGSICALVPDGKRADLLHKQAVTIAFCSADK